MMSPSDEKRRTVYLDMDHLLMVLLLLWSSESAAQIQLRGEVGGNVTFGCPVAKERTITLFYFQKGQIFVNGYYLSKVMPETWENTRMDHENVHMYNLNVSHSGDYQCYIMYSRSHIEETRIHLSVTEPVRLVGGSSRCAGTLQVKRGEWRPVYGSDWTLNSTVVVCRKLDCGSAVSTGMRKESSRKSAWEISSNCVQSRSALRECVSSGSSSSIMEITCSDSVRLVNGTSLCSGRLEVKSNQSNQSNQWWSSVCEADFDQQDAKVVCRELGCGAPSVLQGGLYGEEEAPMWTKEFQCGGNESALLDCGTSGSARNTCSPGEAVGLTCSEPVRLVGGASRCAGTLEVKQGEWRPVYGSYWTLTSAAVVCRKLDCGSAVSTRRRDDSSNRSAWEISSNCVQSGYALRECVSSGSSSSIMEITCSDPAVFIIRLVLLPLALLLFITVIYFIHKATRGQKPGPQENIELDYYNLGVCGAEGGPVEEEGAQAAE